MMLSMFYQANVELNSDNLCFMVFAKAPSYFNC